MTIVYTSKTGITKKYAKMLAEMTGLSAVSLDEADIPGGEEIIYFGWLCAGAISGYKKAQKQFVVRAVCGVGMTPDSEKQTYDLRANNKISHDTTVFYLPGGYNLEKLKGASALILKTVGKKVKAGLEKKSERTPDEDVLLDILTNGGDFASQERLEPIVQWLQSTQNIG